MREERCSAVCDRDRIIATAGIPKKDLLDKPVSKQLDELMRRKKAFISSGEDTVLAAEGGLRTANAAFPNEVYKRYSFESYLTIIFLTTQLTTPAMHSGSSVAFRPP